MTALLTGHCFIGCRWVWGAVIGEEVECLWFNSFASSPRTGSARLHRETDLRFDGQLGIIITISQNIAG